MKNNITLIVVLAYMILLLGISWYATKLMKSKDSSNFLFAGSRLPSYLVAVMVAGVAVGGASTIGVAEKAYASGMAASWYNAAWAFAAIFYGFFMAKKVRRTKWKTVNQMFGAVYGNKFMTVSVIVQVITIFVINAMQIVAGGAILSSLLPQYFTYVRGMAASTVVFTAITYIGGLWAASLSNLINVIVIYIGIILGTFSAIKNFGGLDAVTAALPKGPDYMSFTSGIALPVIIGWFITMFMNAMPHTAVTQSVVSARTPKDAKRGIITAGILMVPVGVLAALFGVVGLAQFPNLESAAMALPKVAMTLNPWIAGITLAGLWAADVSTATGFIMGGSLMITKDIIVKYFKKDMDDVKQLKLARIIVIGVALLGFLSALQVKSILDVMMKALTLFTPFTVILLATFLFPRFAKKSTPWWVFIPGFISFIVTTFLVPGLAVMGEPVYTTLLVSAAGLVLSNIVDKTPADTQKLYE